MYVERCEEDWTIVIVIQDGMEHDDWVNQINQWQEAFNAFDDRKNLSTTQVNPYNFVDRISDNLKENSKVFIDTGCSIAWFMQSIRTPKTVRVFHDFNNTAMGWALPASIGGYYADLGKSPIITIVGDGGFMMTSYELATAMHNNIPLKIFIMNNQGYSMIQQTQDQWLDSNYYASSKQGGISFPDFQKLSKAYNFKYFELKDDSDLHLVEEIFAYPKALICNVFIDNDFKFSFSLSPGVLLIPFLVAV